MREYIFINLLFSLAWKLNLNKKRITMNTYQILGTGTFIELEETQNNLELSFSDLKAILNSQYGESIECEIFAEPSKIHGSKIIELQRTDYNEIAKKMGYTLLQR